MPLAMTDEAAVGEEAYTYEELNAMTKVELLEIAAEYGVEDVSMNNLKDEIINSILDAQ